MIDLVEIINGSEHSQIHRVQTQPRTRSLNGSWQRVMKYHQTILPDDLWRIVESYLPRDESPPSSPRCEVMIDEDNFGGYPMVPISVSSPRR